MSDGLREWTPSSISGKLLGQRVFIEHKVHAVNGTQLLIACIPLSHSLFFSSLFCSALDYVHLFTSLFCSFPVVSSPSSSLSSYPLQARIHPPHLLPLLTYPLACSRVLYSSFGQLTVKRSRHLCLQLQLEESEEDRPIVVRM